MREARCQGRRAFRGESWPLSLAQLRRYAGWPGCVSTSARQRTPIVPIPQLIALKLYAGGYKSKADIVELLSRNPELNLAEIRAVCERYRLSGLEELSAEAA